MKRELDWDLFVTKEWTAGSGVGEGIGCEEIGAEEIGCDE